MMNALYESFLKLPYPKQDHVFAAILIPNLGRHRIAKDRKGSPAILISTKSNGSRFKADQHLYNLSIQYQLQCVIEDDIQNNPEQFTVISFSGIDEALTLYFFKICSLFLHSIPAYPTLKEVQVVTNGFIELFRTLQEPPRKQIQGLWGELLLIHLVSNKQELVRAWHAYPEERYDFGLDGLRIEVKSSSNRRRSHHFTAAQLNPPKGVQLYIVSIFVEPSVSGKTISELMFEIESSLVDTDLVAKLRRVAYATLGSQVMHIDTIRFDFEVAYDSVQVFESSKVPKIELIPQQLSELRFVSDLSGIEALSVEDFFKTL